MLPSQVNGHDSQRHLPVLSRNYDFESVFLLVVFAPGYSSEEYTQKNEKQECDPSLLFRRDGDRRCRTSKQKRMLFWKTQQRGLPAQLRSTQILTTLALFFHSLFLVSKPWLFCIRTSTPWTNFSDTLQKWSHSMAKTKPVNRSFATPFHSLSLPWFLSDYLLAGWHAGCG